MGALVDTANTLLGVVRDCVISCDVYPRQFIYVGSPVIDCDTIAVSIGNSDVISITNKCSIQSTQFVITLARCCWPTVQSDGSPPTPDEINAAVECLMLDVEAVLCCLTSISLEGEGIVGRCRPKVTGTRVKNPTGACSSVDVLVQIETKSCCPPSGGE